MTAQELWKQFKRFIPVSTDAYEAWMFGAAPDKLLGLVMQGKKRGTASAYEIYVAENQKVPEPGDYSVLLNSKNEAVCIIQDVSVTIKPFREISEVEAKIEGEGDSSLAYWRNVHEEFFTEEMQSIQKTFSEDMIVVFEEFKVVFDLSLVK